MQIGKSARSNRSHIKSRLKMEPHGVFKEVTKQCTNKDHYQSSAGLVIPHVSEVLQSASVGKDVEEAQELPVNPSRGGHDARQKGVGGARPGGICLAVTRHLDARSGLKELVDIGVAQLPVAGDVSAEVATELMGAGNVDY